MSAFPAKSKNKGMSDFAFKATAGLLTSAAVIGGVSSGLQPTGAGWRFFSYHPLFVSAKCME